MSWLPCCRQPACIPRPVQNARDLNASTFLRHRGLTQRVTHPAAGTHDYQGLALHISGWDLAIKRPRSRVRPAQ